MRCNWRGVLRRLTILTLLAPALAVSLQAREAAKRVWIDTDAACVPKLATDPDDCWALALILNDPRVEVVGISTVFGNRSRAPSVEEMETFIVAASRTKRSQHPMRIVEGASGPSDDRQSPNSAVDALISELNKGPLTILALGPLTNIAATMTRRPDLSDRIVTVVAVAGQRSGERFYPGESKIFHVHDMNFRKDVQAFQTVLGLGAKLTLVPYAAGRQITIGEAELARLRGSIGPSRWLAEISQGWLEFWQRSFRVNGFFPFDLVAAAQLALPGYIDCRQTRARIVYRRGLFTVRHTLEVDGSTGQKVIYCDKVKLGLADNLISKIQNSLPQISSR